MSLRDVLFGKWLASSEEERQRVGTIAAIPMLGLDALGSAAYGPEAALTLLLPLGVLGLRYILPISLLIIVLLYLVYLSYRQTIAAYPTGGGSYTVARRNLGVSFGLLAAAALLLDYILVVAIGHLSRDWRPRLRTARFTALYSHTLPHDARLHRARKLARCA